MSATAARIDSVSKAFGSGKARKVAVHELSLSIPHGSVYGVIGRNGAGKTTTLRMLTGILAPDSGEVRILDGCDPRKARDRIGYLPEEKGLYRKMRTLDLAIYFGRLKGLSKADARQRANELLAVFELAEVASNRADTLSKGMGQKLQLACTLMHDPELLVLDEPFSGLDPVNIERLQQLIIERRDAGRCVVLSTHIMEQAERLCDAVALIDRGELAIEGPLATVTGSDQQRLMVTFDDAPPELSDTEKAAIGVLDLTRRGQQMELNLKPGTLNQDVIAWLNARATIRSLSVGRRSLQDVFVELTDAPT